MLESFHKTDAQRARDSVETALGILGSAPIGLVTRGGAPYGAHAQWNARRQDAPDGTLGRGASTAPSSPRQQRPGIGKSTLTDLLSAIHGENATSGVALYYLNDRRYRSTGDRVKGQEHLTTAVTMYREMDMGSWLEKAEAARAGKDP